MHSINNINLETTKDFWYHQVNGMAHIIVVEDLELARFLAQTVNVDLRMDPLVFLAEDIFLTGSLTTVKGSLWNLVQQIYFIAAAT